MNNLEQATLDFEHAPVPDQRTVSGWKIAIVKIGSVIALPAFMTGAQLGAELGLKVALLAMVAGGAILGLIAGFTGTVAARSRLPTALIIQFAFGRRGAMIVNAVLATSLLGWFGVTTSLFGSTLHDVLAGLPLDAPVYMAFGGVLMIVTTICGFQALKRMSDVIVPILFALLVAVVIVSMRRVSLERLLAVRGHGMSIGLGISAVVGGLIVGATIFPDICRFARNTRHALLASMLGFVLAIPAVLVVGAIPGVATGENDLFRIMINLGLTVPALVVLVFASWTTNVGNLYSASLGLTGIFDKTAKWKLCAAAGTLGTLLAISGISGNFIPLLVLLGISIPPITGIYVADFFLVHGQRYELDALHGRPPYSIPAFAAWALAIGVAYATSKGVLRITGVPALDSMSVAFCLYAPAALLARARRREVT